MKHKDEITRLKSWDRDPDSPEINQALTDLRQAFKVLFFSEPDHSGLQDFIESLFTEMQVEETRLLLWAFHDAEAEVRERNPDGFDIHSTTKASSSRALPDVIDDTLTNGKVSS